MLSRSVVTCQGHKSCLATAVGRTTVAMEETSSADRQDFDWPPLESNPDVFNDYLHQVGLAESFAVGEIYGFDEDLLAFVPQPVYGVIVALEKVEKQHNVGDDSYLIPFYMKQAGTLDNACGIIACLHAILNVAATSEPSIIMTDSVLHQFQALTATQTPTERCHSLEKNLDFRTELCTKGLPSKVNLRPFCVIKVKSSAITSLLSCPMDNSSNWMGPCWVLT